MAPVAGTVEGGYEFIGGDPASPDNWAPVAQQASLQAQPSGGPPGANYQTIDPEMRAIVSKLPSDALRKQALEQMLRNRGVPDPQVQGQGRDWFMQDPQSGALNALTNTPEWDRFDALEGAVELPRTITAAVGGTLGALGGAVGGPPGAIAGAIGGAGVGGGLGDVATRAALAAYSPEFRGIAEENLGAMAKDVGINAAIDAGTAGIAKGAAPAARALFGPAAGAATKSIVNNGVVSPVLRGAGAAAETLGGGAASVARTMQTPFGRSVATMGIPGMAETEAVGELAQLPAAAARNLPKGMQKVGSYPFVQENFPKAAEWLRGTGQSIRRAASPADLAEEGLAKFRVSPQPPPRVPTSGGVLREVSQRGAQALGASPRVAKTAGQVANVVGQGADALATAGKGVATGARGVAGVGLGGVEAGGRLMQGLGKATNRAGTLASPFESRAGIQAGLDRGGDEFRDYLDRLRRERARSNMDLILAGQ